MIYQYRCLGCDHVFDVVKSFKEFTRDECCPHCMEPSRYEFIPNARALLKQSGMQESAEYNPGLGCIVKDKSHRKELCKIKGVEEVGNEPPDNLHKYYDKRRQEKLDNVYEEATKGWVGDGSA